MNTPTARSARPASSSAVTAITATSALAGSDFLRLLAAWGLAAPAGAAGAAAAFGQRLSEWFSWTDAIALSGALGGPAEPVPAGLLTAAERLAVETRELARVRQQLLGHIRGEPAGARSRPAARVAVSPHVQARLAAEQLGDEGFAPHRQRCLAVHKAMDNAIGALRQRVRDAVAAASPALAHLATLDVVMEDVVGGRERALLAQLPGLLAQRYERLQAEDAEHLSPRFQRELQQLLEAELDFRLHPVEGLLDALRQAATH